MYDDDDDDNDDNDDDDEFDPRHRSYFPSLISFYRLVTGVFSALIFGYRCHRIKSNFKTKEQQQLA